MALQNILNAIVTDADKRISEASSEHKKRMKLMREESERAILRKRQSIMEQKEQKKRQLKEKAESHARMLRSKIILGKKQEYTGKIYADVLQRLINLPKDKTEIFLKRCLSEVTGKGEIRASKNHEDILKKLIPDGCKMGKNIDSAGGFRFVSDKEEHDFTYEFIINDLVRPGTETTISTSLFKS